MPCYYPNTAYKTADGSIVFNELKRNGPIIKTLTLACGQCHGCRLERSRAWAMRCVHETNLYKRNCFITLTYDDDNLPYRNQLTQRDFQLFMKRLRKHCEPTQIRFFMGGEYGGTNPVTKRIDGGKYRPHYHAIIFNWDFEDRVHLKKNRIRRINRHINYTTKSLAIRIQQRRKCNIRKCSIHCSVLPSESHWRRR